MSTESGSNTSPPPRSWAYKFLFKSSAAAVGMAVGTTVGALIVGAISAPLVVTTAAGAAICLACQKMHEWHS
jgi:hypothetical protein